MSVDWIITLVIFWWAIWFWFLINWYEKEINEGRKEPIAPMVLFFLFVFSGFTPLIGIVVIIARALALNNGKDK